MSGDGGQPGAKDDLFDARVAAYIRRFLAEKCGAQVGQITSYSFEASPGRVYSEYTEESFDCCVRVVLSTGQQLLYWLDENEVCGFLNAFPKPIDAGSSAPAEQVPPGAVLRGD